MNKFLACFLMIFFMQVTLAKKSPFTNMEFGSFAGRGEFIKIEIEGTLEPSVTYLLLEVNGVTTNELLAHARSKYASNYKCVIAEKLPTLLSELGVINSSEDIVDLKLYLLNRGHQVKDFYDVPMTEENLLLLQFERNYCL